MYQKYLQLQPARGHVYYGSDYVFAIAGAAGGDRGPAAAVRTEGCATEREGRDDRDAAREVNVYFTVFPFGTTE